MTILLVEDDDDDVSIFSDAIADIDRSIILLTAYNGHEALAILQSEIEPPDHIFLDINMPLMNGLDCLEQMRKLETQLLVTVLTTTKNPFTINRIRELGAAYIAKPDTYNELLNSIKQRLVATNP